MQNVFSVKDTKGSDIAPRYTKRHTMHGRRNIPRMSSERRSASFLLLVTFLASFVSVIQAQRQQDPFAINGGSILAMAGKDSVAVAVDKRFGSGPQVIQRSDMSCGCFVYCCFSISISSLHCL